MSLVRTAKAGTSGSRYILCDKKSNWQNGLDKREQNYVNRKLKEKEYFITIDRLDKILMLQFTDEFAKKTPYAKMEGLRTSGYKAVSVVNLHKYDALSISGTSTSAEEYLAVAEGAALGNYQFVHYRSDQKEKKRVKNIYISSKSVTAKDVDELNTLIEAVYMARDLVNEPQNVLDAPRFAKEMQAMGKAAGFKVEVLNKKQIESLKMGGLLAVNQGSNTPPTFTIMEYKPAQAKNKNPLVLVGKGVVYDTGGLSLKPTPNSMDTMKCDMAGGACVAAAMYAVAKSKLPYHVIALVPASDNRPGEDAYTPGDVIRLFDGQTVEVLNTDAEGRLLLGDALAYAKKYKPELVLDFATLTGAAANAIGPYGMVCMGNLEEDEKNRLKETGLRVHERLVEFPFWEDYNKLIKSDIADMKNIGGPVGGAITAGKFLEKFVDYPWMHFDIAGPAFINIADGYRGKNATGYGVRFLFDYIREKSK